MKTININGIEFEAIKPRKRHIKPRHITSLDYMNIFEAYDNPSNSKIEIWNDWSMWQYKWYNYKVTDMCISGRNCFSFTIMANVWDYKTGFFVGVLHITRDHDRIYLA